MRYNNKPVNGNKLGRLKCDTCRIDISYEDQFGLDLINQNIICNTDKNVKLTGLSSLHA